MNSSKTLMHINLICLISLQITSFIKCCDDPVKSSSIKLMPIDRAVILYSGGLDSSAVAATMAAKGYRELHLLTFDNGVQNHLDYSKIKLPDFEKRFPQTKFIHVIIPASYIFKKIALVDIESDFKDYETNLVCAGCKMAMHSLALLYAVKHQISQVLDGFARRQEDFPEQDPCFKEKMKAVYSQYAITYDSPLYETLASRNAAQDILARYNLSTKSIEPGCLFGGTFSKATTEHVGAYFQKKTPVMIDYINRELSEKGFLAE